MITGTGVDIIETDRVEHMLDRFGERFERKMFTALEIEYCRRKPRSGQHFAARFAAKEAAMKALGTGWRGVGWREIEVVNAPSGRPDIRLTGRAAERARAMGIDALHVSLTHCNCHAIAYVIAESLPAAEREHAT
jgi:holo-[acyl-carrier protein] synthase